MNKAGILVTLLGSALALAACSPGGSEEQAAGGQSMLGELPARFQGKLPCADCPGIRYELSLYADHAYAMERTYLGTPDQHSRAFEMGEWALADGSGKLTLTPSGDGQASKWRVASTDKLEALSSDGQPIESELDYTLKRTGEPTARPLEGTYWKLVRLNDETVDSTAQKREPHLVLHKDKTRVAGATGCNRLMGQYSHGDGTLKFSKLGSTRMACPEPAMQTEQAFTNALGDVRSYRILADHLVVYDGKHKRLALFRATAMQ